uniref:5'-nucleotidase, cytosolic IB b n=1 Tax=Gasterosteus aculeatus aculeatus TaxID=481459 RepID=A0AAQ4NTM2_GASAC
MSEIKAKDFAPTGDAGEEKDAAKAHFDNLKTNKPRPPKPQYAVTIAVSSRTLFNMVTERKIYEDQGLEEYVAYQRDHENEPLMPGPAFPFVKALMTVNARLRQLYPDSEELFDIVLMTNNHAQVGVRLINSINHYGTLHLQPDISRLARRTAAAAHTFKGSPLYPNLHTMSLQLPFPLSDLTIERFCMTGGESPTGYLEAYMTNLYLSKDSEKVSEAIEEGIAAATMFMAVKENELSDTQLRVAFDGDAVLFSDESEIIVKEGGLDTFFAHEKKFENTPLAQGPLKCFLEALGKLQRKFYAKNERLNCPIRTFLVTARSAASSGARVLKTLRSWGLEIDEALFLAGAPKGPLLQKIKPHIFFDDQMFHIEGARELGTISAHVPYGIGQKYNKGKLIESPAKKK